MTVDQTDTAPTAPPMEAAVQGKHGLRVLFAAFGGADVTAAVDEAVAASGDGSLFVPAWQYTRLFGNPFPAQKKDFAVVVLHEGSRACQAYIFREDQNALIEANTKPCQPARPAEVRAGSILVANYGGADVTAACRNSFSAAAPVSNAFGDPLPTVSKCLVVFYLSVNAGAPAISAAAWSDDGAPPPPAAAASPAAVIVSATYGGKDVTAKTRELHEAGASIPPNGYSAVFGDPFPQERKAFAVVTILPGESETSIHVAEDSDPTEMPVTAATRRWAPPPCAFAAVGEVVQATYGGADVTEKLRDLPPGELCRRPMNDVFGDPLPGVEKTLVVVHRRDEPPNPRRACAFWHEHALFAGEAKQRAKKLPPRPQVLFATYGGVDVTARVQQLCLSGVSIRPREYTSHFGDPFPNQHKDFAVAAVQGQKTHVHVAQDQDSTVLLQPIPGRCRAPQSYSLKSVGRVLQANYGGKDVTERCRALFAAPENELTKRAMNDIFGDPQPGIVKALIVVHSQTKDGAPHRACAYWHEHTLFTGEKRRSILPPWCGGK
ncbi:hypothetical protein DIPPA_07543 [Diplonema papillatum]|nr:hypothetical protein DIPPA_07543 [Diplonema papillatum]